MTDGEVAAFYDEYGAAEWDRLGEGIDGRAEFTFTTRELAAALPDTGRVLDAGGGAGRYAVWLAERGYEVTLVDLSREQVAIAEEQAAEHGVASRVDCHRGTVTDLALAADSFDAVLCLGGPLSHLLAESDRATAVRELVRVARADAPLCVSVMGLLGFVQLQLLTGRNVRALPELLEHGDYDDDLLAPYGYENAFTATHFYRRAEFRSLLAANGVAAPTITALEGLGSPFHDEATRDRLDGVGDEGRDAVLETLDRLRDDPAVADLSVHMLAVGRASSDGPGGTDPDA